MLVVDKICKAYRREKVLEGISFEAEPGTILGICGSNGAGKTTLLKIIASVLPADSGSIYLNEKSVKEVTAYRSQIGYVPQTIALSERLSVYQNLAFWASIRGLKGQALKQEINRVATSFQVDGFLKKRIGHCSGGMARRVNLAAGLLGNPHLVLLDEPISGIDEENRLLILDAIRALKNQQCIVLMVSHYANELSRICDRVLSLHEGKIEASHHAP